jgi:WD40 repeat protein
MSSTGDHELDAPLLTELTQQWSAVLTEAVIDCSWSAAGRVAMLTADGVVMVDSPGWQTRPVCPAPTSIIWTSDGRVVVTDRHLGIVMAGGGDQRIYSLDRTRAVVSQGHRLAVIGGSTVWSLSRDPHGPPDAEMKSMQVDARCRELHAIAPISTALVAVAGSAGVAVVDVGLNLVDTRIELEGVLSIDVNPSGSMVAAGDLSGSIHVFRLGDETNGRELTGYPDRVRTLGWAHAGAWLLASADDELTCWPIGDDGWPADEPISCIGHDEPITALACAAHNDLVITGDAAGEVAVWSLRMPDRPVATLSLGAEVTSITWSLDGSQVAVGTVAGTAQVYRVRRGVVA